MRFVCVIMLAVISGVFGGAILQWIHSPNTENRAVGQRSYERVLKAQSIRCGFGIANPWIYKDANAGEMKGLTVEIFNRIGKSLNLKIDWAEETGWANLAAAINSGRIDVGCSPLWTDPERGKILAFTQPIFYSAVHAYARADDARFTGKIDDVNKPDIKLAVQEANVSLELASLTFPKASQLSLPGSMSGEEVALNIVTHKADVLFAEDSVVENFNKAQDKKLKRVPFPRPLRLYGVAFPVDIHEQELRDMLNIAIADMINSGELETIINKYRKDYPSSFVSVTRPFQ